MPEQAPLSDGWRSWFATCRLVGLSDQQILDASERDGVSPVVAREELAELGGHPYLRAGEGVGFRLRKLEALLDAFRTLRETSPSRGAIERRDSLSEEEFLEAYYSQNRPVILETMAEHWPARAWTPPLLVERYGDGLVEVMTNRRPMSGPQVAQQVLLSAYVESITGIDVPTDQYLVANNRFFAEPGGRVLLADLEPLPPFLRRDAEGTSTFLWLGPPGSVSRLHFDVVNVLFVQLYGRKRFLLLPPEQTPLLYNTAGVFSDVDPEAPDLARHPAFGASRVTEVVLEPGEALLIPVGWWHHVRSLDVSISVSFTGFGVRNEFPALSRSVVP